MIKISFENIFLFALVFGSENLLAFKILIKTFNITEDILSSIQRMKEQELKIL